MNRDKKYKITYKSLSIILVMMFCVAYVKAHDLFIRLDEYYLAVNSTLVARLMNGSFQDSERAIGHDRFRQISLSTPKNELKELSSVEWRDDKTTSTFAVKSLEPGSYVIGASLLPRDISLKADEFNDYLDHDGIPDTLAERKKNNELKKDIKEKYSKHVKAIFQVGENTTDNFKTPLNYPVEIVPMQNPHLLKVGDFLEVQCLVDGKAIANQFVLAGYDGVKKEFSTRTDNNGIAKFEIKKSGENYIKLIHMTKLKGSVYDYESKWATLTFKIKD